MEIELITTKKKLTKSVIQQLDYANTADFNYLTTTQGLILGYINLPDERVFLVKTINGYKKIRSLNWKAGLLSTEACADDKGFGRLKRFETSEQRDDFLKMYREIKRIALLTHIII